MAQTEAQRARELANSLGELYVKYNRKELLSLDPLGLVDPALASADFELVSFVTAGLAYGRVEQIQRSLEQLWRRLESLGLGAYGHGLRDWVVDNSGKTSDRALQRALAGWVHRFNGAEDVTALLKTLGEVARSRGSLGALFAAPPTDNAVERIRIFCGELRTALPDKREAARVRWFTCSPAEGSTCKRLMMWMRWMLRHDEIDPGLWSRRLVNVGTGAGIGAHAAFIPMDTHIHRWALKHNLVSRQHPSWRSVEEVTEFLRTIDAADPTRFDFAICHEGMANYRLGKSRQATLK